MKIGIRLASMELSFPRGLQEAQRLGVAGVQLEAAGGLLPDALSQTGRREVRHRLRGHGLELTALGCPLPRGLDVPEGQEERIDHVRKVLALSYELGARVVVIEVGLVPEDPGKETVRWLTEALWALGQHGDRVGAVLALETGLQAGEVLERYIATFDCGGIGVNFDPANLLLHGFDPCQNAQILAGRIAHVHAKDARKAGSNKTAQEVPLGHGDIDWMGFLDLLRKLEYRGWLTIERETGTNRLADIAAGVGFLRRLMP